jgi:hypothetical protein
LIDKVKISNDVYHSRQLLELDRYLNISQICLIRKEQDEKENLQRVCPSTIVDP